MGRESKLEKDFRQELDRRLPGGFYIKGNSAQRQGIPDRLFLHGEHWAALEFKASGSATDQPNQGWYVDKLNEMSYAAFVTPDNYEEVLDEIQTAFGAEG